MDWNILLSSAIGTMAGTLLSVLVAWCIYHKEKEDNIKRKKKDYKNKIAEECIELINNVVINTFQFDRFFNKSYLHGSNQDKLHEKYFDFVNDFQTNTKKLGISGTILCSLFEIEKFEELQAFVNKSVNLTTDISKIENSDEIKKYIENSVDEIQKLGEEIISAIQEEMVGDIDSDLIEVNKEEVEDTK